MFYNMKMLSIFLENYRQKEWVIKREIFHWSFHRRKSVKMEIIREG